MYAASMVERPRRPIDDGTELLRRAVETIDFAAEAHPVTVTHER